MEQKKVPVLIGLLTSTINEQHSITQATSTLFPTSFLFEQLSPDLFQQAVGAAGNYGEIYDRHWGDLFPRVEGSVNTIHYNDTDGGLLYPNPLGAISHETSHDGSVVYQVPAGTLKEVRQRGLLRCGVISGRRGLTEMNETSNRWMGIDIDYCQGLTAALFGEEENCQDHLVIEDQKSPQDGFVSLANGSIDVLAGAEYNIENDVKEPTTGQGFAFADTYYYEAAQGTGNVSGHDYVRSYSMATREGDSQWSDFVGFVVACTIHAEAHGVTQGTPLEMPVMELYGTTDGPLYRQALRDVLLAIGNYAEIYDRNMEQYVPRGHNPRNTLNTGANPLFFVNHNF